MLSNAALADQVVGRDLDLAPALAAHVDDFVMPEIVEGRIGPVDEAACHHSPGVECDGRGSPLLMRQLLGLRAATTSRAMFTGRYLCRSPGCRRGARSIIHSGVSGSGIRSGSGTERNSVRPEIH
jgi:hypothetical protein